MWKRNKDCPLCSVHFLLSFKSLSKWVYHIDMKVKNESWCPNPNFLYICELAYCLIAKSTLSLPRRGFEMMNSLVVSLQWYKSQSWYTGILLEYSWLFIAITKNWHIFNQIFRPRLPCLFSLALFSSSSPRLTFLHVGGESHPISPVKEIYFIHHIEKSNLP